MKHLCTPNLFYRGSMVILLLLGALTKNTIKIKAFKKEKTVHTIAMHKNQSERQILVNSPNIKLTRK